MNKEFLIDTGYGEEKCKFIFSNYMESFVPRGGIYLGLMYFDTDMGCWGTYCDVSTNLPSTSFLTIPPENAIYIRDDSAWYPGVKKVFEDTGLAALTGIKRRSGFCSYDEWIINIDKLKKIAEEME